MTSTSATRLPWYLNFSMWFIVLGIIGGATLIWFASGQPGLPPQDGRYGCLNADTYEMRKKAARQGVTLAYDIREDQWAATLKGGRLSDVVVYPGHSDFLAAVESRATSNYSFGAKQSPSAFSARMDGVNVVCVLSD